MKFFKNTALVNVSYFDKNGWWVKNGKHHVVAHMTLPPDATETIYTPSAKNKIAKYNKALDKWENEITDARSFDYYSLTGELVKLDYPDEIPDKSLIQIQPPNYDRVKECIIWDGKGWVVKNNNLNKKYYDSHGVEFTALTKDFDINPAWQSWDKMPKAPNGYVSVIENGKWVSKIDNVGKTAYAKNPDTHADYMVLDHSEIPDTHTLFVKKPFHEWKEDKNSWVYSKDLEKPEKAKIEEAWVTSEITAKRDELINHLIDSQLAQIENYKPLNKKALTNAKIAEISSYIENLKKYLKNPKFPFSKRPTA